eukprot:COSAG05_NODE_10876_length_541_cov_1.115385_1_plen_46_part_10
MSGAGVAGTQRSGLLVGLHGSGESGADRYIHDLAGDFPSVARRFAS